MDGMKWKIQGLFLKIFTDWQLSNGKTTFKKPVLKINPLGELESMRWQLVFGLCRRKFPLSYGAFNMNKSHFPDFS
jgi:hypothetical protein